MNSRCVFWILLGLALCASALSLAQEKNADDLIAVREWLSEEDILGRLEKDGVAGMDADDFERLRQAGFSEEFVARLRRLMPDRREKAASEPEPGETSRPAPAPEEAEQQLVPEPPPQGEKKFHLLRIAVDPPDAGKVLVTPEPDERGRLEAGSDVTLWPEAKPPYLFDQWQGDLRGYQPIRLTLTRDLDVKAVFREAVKPKAPPRIQDPVVFRETRREGYRYQGEVVGVVDGRGVSKDWGIAGEVEYNYVYCMKYTSEIVSNDGYRIRERRTFDDVNETMLVSKYSFRLDLREDFVPVLKFVKNAGKAISLLGELGSLSPDPQAQILAKIAKTGGRILEISAPLMDLGLAAAEKVTLDKEQVDWVFRNLGQVPGVGKTMEKLRERVANPQYGRILGYAPALKLLEGKKFDLEYEDGIGLVQVDAVDEGQIVNARERELLERAFYLSDYYIFRDRDNPRRSLEIGDRWQVDARTLAGVLDPRLRHQAQGSFKFRRVPDRESMAAFRLEGGRVQMVPSVGRQRIEGEMEFTEGEILYDLDLRYVAQASFAGIAEYREVSTDHMFFGARLSTQPRVSIRYECKAVGQ